MTPRQAVKELDEMIGLSARLGEYALFVNQKYWNHSDTKWVYMNVMLNISNRLEDVKEALAKK